MRALILDKFAASRHAGPSTEVQIPLGTELRPAGVLVPLIDRPGGMTVLLTRRTAHLQHHAGQISFPGGGLQDTDEGPVAAALRETEEEIGLARERIEVVGFLPNWATLSGYRVTPVVGIVTPEFELKLDPSEVAEVFEVPLEFILDPHHHQPRTVHVRDRDWITYTLVYEGHEIWGTTGGILVNLYNQLAGGAPLPNITSA